MKLSEKLLIRLRKELKMVLPADARIERTYAGHWQRSAGAFIWIVEPWGGKLIIGSQERVRDLLRCPELVVETWWGDWAICSADGWKPTDDAVRERQ